MAQTAFGPFLSSLAPDDADAAPMYLHRKGNVGIGRARRPGEGGRSSEARVSAIARVTKENLRNNWAKKFVYYLRKELF